MMEHVFVTGATGFVGQCLLGALAQEVGGDSSHVRLRVLTRIPHPDYESVVCDLQSDNVPDDALNGVVGKDLLIASNRLAFVFFGKRVALVFRAGKALYDFYFRRSDGGVGQNIGPPAHSQGCDADRIGTHGDDSLIDLFKLKIWIVYPVRRRRPRRSKSPRGTGRTS